MKSQEEAASAQPLDMLRVITLVAQFLVVLPAISVLFGRIYFVRYYQELGLPEAALKLNIIDYAVFSPDVAIVTVGIVLGMTLLTYIQLTGTRFVSTGSSELRRRLGGFLFIGGVTWLLMNIITKWSEVMVGVQGLFIAGGYLISFVGLDIYNEATSKPSEQVTRRGLGKVLDLDVLNLLKVSNKLRLAGLWLTILFALLFLTHGLAESKAKAELANSPIARIEFKSSEASTVIIDESISPRVFSRLGKVIVIHDDRNRSRKLEGSGDTCNSAGKC